MSDTNLYKGLIAHNTWKVPFTVLMLECLPDEEPRLWPSSCCPRLLLFHEADKTCGQREGSWLSPLTLFTFCWGPHPLTCFCLTLSGCCLCLDPPPGSWTAGWDPEIFPGTEPDCWRTCRKTKGCMHDSYNYLYVSTEPFKQATEKEVHCVFTNLLVTDQFIFIKFSYLTYEFGFSSGNLALSHSPKTCRIRLTVHS